MVRYDSPRIFYYCYDHQRPTGGQKLTYHHVDILRRAGIDAFVLHQRNGFRLDWFSNNTPVLDFRAFKALYRRELDYIVLPEDGGFELLQLGGRAVIFHKNPLYGFLATERARQTFGDPYLNPAVVGVITVSMHSAEMLRFAYPKIKVGIVHLSIDEREWPLPDLSNKTHEILVSPKAENEVAMLQEVLRARSEAGLNQVQTFKWTRIQGYSHQALKGLFMRAALVIYLNVHDGEPTVVLEALASGCIVFGFGAGVLRDTLPKEYQFEFGDILGIARAIEETCSDLPKSLQKWNSTALRARGRVLEMTPEKEESELLATWDGFFGST